MTTRLPAEAAPAVDAPAVAAAEPVFPFDRGCPYRQPAEYDDLRRAPGPTQVPLAPGGRAWLVTRHDQVRAALADDRLGNDRTQPGYPAPIAIPDEFRVGGSLLGMDPPRHGEYRRIVAGEFTHVKAQAMRPRVQAIVDGLIDRMIAGGPVADLHAQLAVATTLTVITGMLGISFDEVRHLHAYTRVMFSGDSTPQQRRDAVTQMNDYCVGIVRRKHEHPEDDLLSRLMQRWPDPVDHAEAGNMARLLLNGGHDSTASMISLGVLTLLEHPDQLRLLQDHPDLTPSAVEELLRYLTVTDLTTARVATAPLTLGGVGIEAGDGVFPLTGAANRDPEVFERPDELDITRGRRDHLTFGYGRHLCLGADIARVELEITYRTLFTRLPGLRLAVPREDLVFRQGGLVYGLQELPVTW